MACALGQTGPVRKPTKAHSDGPVAIARRVGLPMGNRGKRDDVCRYHVVVMRWGAESHGGHGALRGPTGGAPARGPGLAVRWVSMICPRLCGGQRRRVSRGAQSALPSNSPV